MNRTYTLITRRPGARWWSLAQRAESREDVTALFLAESDRLPTCDVAAVEITGRGDRLAIRGERVRGHVLHVRNARD